MPLDPSIYSQIQQPKFNSPFENLQGALTIKSLMDQSAIAPLQKQLMLQKGQADIENTQAKTQLSQAQAAESNLKMMRDSLASVQNDADLARHKELVARIAGPDAAASLPQSVSDPTFNEVRIQKIMSADQMLERLSPKPMTTNEKAQLALKAIESDPFGNLGGRDVAVRYGALPGKVGAQNSVASSQATMLHGDDLLKSLPQPVADQVKALAEGRMAFPAGFALKSPYWQNMISMVSQYDPSFDAVNYNARNKTRADFVSGKSAENVTALNTAIAHLQNLSDSYDKLGNSDYPLYNTVANFAGKNLGNRNVQGNLASVSTDAEAVSHELAKVFRSTGMSEGEINSWKEKINTSSTPAEQKAVINGALELMNGRLEALADRYNKGMGTTSQPLELLSPKSKDIVNRLQGGKQQTQQPEQPEPTSQPTRQDIEAELRRRGVIK